MSHTLHIKAFFFNAKTDYLPYYKNFTLLLPDNAVAKDILVAIQAQNTNFSYPESNLIFKINGLIVEEHTTLTNIVNKLGTILTIDPVNNYRSYNGLSINDDDFMRSYELLAPYSTDSDKKYYKTLYALHYASETEKFDRDYIGDAILVLAHKMISEGNEHKNQILHAITSVNSGLLDCEYENNLFKQQHHTAAITSLKHMVRGTNKVSPSLIDKLKILMKIQGSKQKKKRNNYTFEDLKNKQVAYYPGISHNTTTLEAIKNHNFSIVNFSRMHKLSGTSILNDNKTLAFKKAGETLLSAYDAGAELLIIEDKMTYNMMQNHFSAIENTVGRKMLGLELISSEDFMSQLND